MRTFSLSTLCSFLFSLSLLTSCGKSIVESFDVETQLDANGDVYVESTAGINLDGLTLGSTNLTVYNPQTDEMLGSISIAPSITSGLNEVSLDINISEIINLSPIMSCNLPNGSALPFGGIDQVHLTCVPVGSKGGVVYLAADLSGQLLFVGYALVINEFDTMGKYLKNSNIFPGIRFNNDIQVYAGLFTSQNSGQSGIAVFANIGSVIPADTFVALEEGAANKSFMAYRSAGLSELHAKDATTGQMSKISKALKQIKKKSKVVHVRR